MRTHDQLPQGNEFPNEDEGQIKGDLAPGGYGWPQEEHPENIEYTIPGQREAETPTPESIPETETEEDKKKPISRGRKILAGIAAALTLGGGVGAIFVAKGAHDVNAQSPDLSSPPAATGPAVAGAPTGETTPSAEISPKELNSQTYKYKIDGKEYVGESKLIEGVAVKNTEYPTYKEATPVFIDRINDWLNSGGDAEDIKQSEGFTSYDQTRTGVEATAQDFSNIAWTNALTARLPEAQADGFTYPKSWLSEMSSQHLHNVGNKAKNGGELPYKSGYEIVKNTGYGGADTTYTTAEAKGYTQVNFKTIYHSVESNGTPKEEEKYVRMVLTKVDDLWFIVHFDTEDVVSSTASNN